MISIKEKITPQIREWYLSKMSEKVKSKVRALSETPDIEFDSFYRNLKAIDDEFIKILLIGSRSELEEKRPWVSDYLGLCDTYSRICWEARKGAKEYVEGVRKILSEIKSVYVESVVCQHKKSWKNEKLSTKKQADELKKQLDEKLEKANNLVMKAFEYDDMSDEIRHELLERMDIRVCPYCNRNIIPLIKYVNRKGKIKLAPPADIDHGLPKSVYQLFSLSIWNFVPSCKPCNQVLKKDKTAKILSPGESGFDEDCSFTLDLSKCENSASLLGFGDDITGCWKVEDVSPKREEIENSIELFRLNDQYRLHSNEIREVLQKRYLEGNFHKILNDFLKEQGKNVPILTDKDINRLLYGVSLDPDSFVDEPMAKMIYDIIKK